MLLKVRNGMFLEKNSRGCKSVFILAGILLIFCMLVSCGKVPDSTNIKNNSKEIKSNEALTLPEKDEEFVKKIAL